MGIAKRRRSLVTAHVKADEFVVAPNAAGFDLSTFDPRSKAWLENKDDGRKALERNAEKLAKLHDVFAAQSQHALLIVLQGIDAAGKDRSIKHAMSGMNRKASTSTVFANQVRKKNGTTFCGARARCSPLAAGTQSSTGRIMKKSSSCAFTPSFWRGRVRRSFQSSGSSATKTSMPLNAISRAAVRCS